MRRTLHVDPGDAVPIWRQIEQGVRQLVAAGILGPGDPVPSVRELARQFRINPATVAKAYQRLTADGLLLIRRGEGTFVTDRPPELADAERRAVLHQGALRYASLALTSGTARKGAVRVLNSAWDELHTAVEGTENG
jgi:GntR family transcriptional regulator